MKFQIPDPAVKRTILVKTAGFIWVLVGLFLIIRGILNFKIFNVYTFFFTIIAVLMGYLKARFIFYKIISKNLNRIKLLSPEKEKVCVFAFQAIQSYLIVFFMIFLGWLLRISHLNTDLLSFIYILIGSALLISSIKYFKSTELFTTRQEDNQCQTP